MSGIDALQIIALLRYAIDMVGTWFVSFMTGTHMLQFFLAMFTVTLFVRLLLGPLLGHRINSTGSDTAEASNAMRTRSQYGPPDQLRSLPGPRGLPPGQSDKARPRISRK